MNITYFTLAFAIVGLSLQGLAVNASEPDLNTGSAEGIHDLCKDVSCHIDATCISLGADLFECKCNSGLVGDGITACEAPNVPKDISTSTERKRALKKKKVEPSGPVG